MKPRMVEPLSIDMSTEEGEAVLSVNGRITIDSSPVLRDRLLAILRQESLPTLAIDLSAVPYIDGSGLATLVEALKFARAANTGLRLRLQERPLYLFQVTGLLQLFDLSGDGTTGAVSQGDT